MNLIKRLCPLLLLLSFILFPFSSFTSAEEQKQPLTLKDAIRLALENNPNIEAMVQSVKKSQYLYSAASKEWLPVIGTDYNFTGFPQKVNITDSENDTQFPIVERTNLMWTARAKMPLYTSGAITLNKSIAKLGVDVARMKYLEAKSDLIQEVTINYLNVLRCRHYIDVAKESVVSFTEHENVTQKYFDVGNVAKNTFLEVRVKRANAQQDLIVADKELKIAQAALAVNMGLNVDSQFELEDIPECRAIPCAIDQCYQLAKKNNPSLAAFTYLQDRAKQVISLEKTGTLPKVYGAFSYFRHGKSPALKGDDYFTNDITMGVVEMNWDVFDWFKTADKASSAKKELEMVIAENRSLENIVSLDIKDAYLNMEAAQSKFEVIKHAIEFAEENYRISKDRYKEMVAKSTEVNDSLVLLKKAHYDYYTTLFEYNTSLAMLERAIGKGISLNEKETEK